MKKIFLMILLFGLFAPLSFGTENKSEKSASQELLRKNDEDMVLVTGFYSNGIEYDFKIGRYEVTQELYEAVMGTNPSYYSKNPQTGESQKHRPVEFVTWFDAVYFCNKLTELTMGKDECCYLISDIKYKTDDEKAQKEKFIREDPTYKTYIVKADVKMNHNKKGFRLPTREEWLFAASGGKKSQNYKFSGSDDLNEVAWWLDNSNSKTHEVGLLKPNELGLYDMTGNVQEFCENLAFYYNSKGFSFPRRISCGGNCHYNIEDSELDHYLDALAEKGNGGTGIRLVSSSAHKGSEVELSPKCFNFRIFQDGKEVPCVGGTVKLKRQKFAIAFDMRKEESVYANFSESQDLYDSVLDGWELGDSISVGGKGMAEAGQNSEQNIFLKDKAWHYWPYDDFEKVRFDIVEYDRDNLYARRTVRTIKDLAGKNKIGSDFKPIKTIYMVYCKVKKDEKDRKNLLGKSVVKIVFD